AADEMPDREPPAAKHQPDDRQRSPASVAVGCTTLTICSELRLRKGFRDRAVRATVEDQTDVAPGHLDAVGVRDDAAMPADDAVAARVDAGQAHAVAWERARVPARELARAGFGEAARVARAAADE